VTRLVIDASILLSTVVGKPDNSPAVLLDAVRSGNVEMVACAQLLDEVRAALAGRYFRDRISPPQREAIPAMLAPPRSDRAGSQLAAARPP
jgi:predicted nucleic acid-binding protein